MGELQLTLRSKAHRFQQERICSSVLYPELRSCVKREVGLGSHSLSHSSPVPNKLYGFCGRKAPWKRKKFCHKREADSESNLLFYAQSTSNLLFYAQSTSTVMSGRWERERERERETVRCMSLSLCRYLYYWSKYCLKRWLLKLFSKETKAVTESKREKLQICAAQKQKQWPPCCNTILTKSVRQNH